MREKACGWSFPFGKRNGRRRENGIGIFWITSVYIIHLKIPPKGYSAQRLLGGEAGATLNTAALQDFLAIFGAVAFHEAVFNFTLTFVWLISPFWHNIVLLLL